MSASGHQIIEHLIDGHDLDKPSMQQLINAILAKEWPDVQVAAALALLRAKGECGQEISTAAKALLGMASEVAKPTYACADIVGTGGDGFNTINVSTMASLVAAACGIPMAKHGNASASSKCGSADVLSELKVDIRQSPSHARRCLDENHWCFLFAPLYHPAFLQVRDVRQKLKIKTIFNILGPLINPMDPQVMMVGVYHERLLCPIAESLQAMGKKSALVVHGSGLDEVTLHARTSCAKLTKDGIEIFDIGPSDFGLKTYSLQEFIGGDVRQNAAEFIKILSGEGSEAKTSLVAASAGALLWTAGRAFSLSSGVDKAREALRVGSALEVLKRVQRYGHGS